VDKNQYDALVKELQKHDRLYYSKSAPEISDYKYDMLLKGLEEIEKKHPSWVSPNSPTQRVGETVTEAFSQVAHRVPMLSLSNTYSKQELEEFFLRVEKGLDGKKPEFCSELKMDGIAVSVLFKKGKLVRGMTRGNGKKGDDITANIKAIRSLPFSLNTESPPDVLEVRGEVFMRKEVFHALNAEKEERGEEPWANPRNAAAGSLKLLDPKETARRKLSVVFYAIAEDSSSSCKTQMEVHSFLQELGLPVCDPTLYTKSTSAKQVLEFADFVEKQRPSLPYDIDGIVIKVDDLKWQESLGATGKHQKWAVAYKFAPEQALTKITSITVQVGRTGVLTPVAELRPTLLAGSTVSRATLHNQEEVTRKDIREGDFVWIEKGGDVIPKVVQVDLSKREAGAPPWHMPRECPCCLFPVVQVEGEVAKRCPNKDCKEQKLGEIAFFVSKGAMDIANLGEKVARQLFDRGLIQKASDLYSLTEKDLAPLEGFKEKSIKNLLQSIEKSKECSLPAFILALGIQYVGAGTAESLAKAALNIGTLAAMTMDDLLRIEGVGKKVAESVFSFFQEEKEEVEALLSSGIMPKAEVASDPSHPFFEKVFVLTGSLENLTRSQASALIKENGGRVSSSISAKVDFVLAGEDAGSKLDKAKKLNLPLLSEKGFMSMISD
jgi:DNA ligase (NAD+)